MQLQPLKFNEIANQNLVSLQSFLKNLDMQNVDYDYCNTLRSRIIPFIRFIYPNEVAEWDRKKVTFVKEAKKLNKKIIAETARIWEHLKAQLSNHGLLVCGDIKKACDKLEALLEFSPANNMFFGAIEPIVRGLKEVCFAVTRHGRADFAVKIRHGKTELMIMQHGRADLVEEYVESFATVHEYVDDEIIVFEQHISSFKETTFVPSYLKWWQLYDEFITSTAGAWDRLCGIEWGWSKPRREVFRRKSFDYNSLLTVTRSAQYVVERSYWQTIKTVKTLREAEKDSSLSREKLEGIKLQVQVVRKQAQDDLNVIFKTVSGKSIEQTKLLATDYVPKAVRLTLDPFHKELYIIVEWADDICEVKRRHVFHEIDDNRKPSIQEKILRFLSDFLKLPHHLIMAWLKKSLKVDSKPTKRVNVNRDFIKTMLFNSGEIVSIKPPHEPKAQKILQDVGIYGPFDEIFVVKKRGYRAALSADVLDLTDKPKELVHALVCCIEGLETVGWQKMISEGPSSELS